MGGRAPSRGGTPEGRRGMWPPGVQFWSCSKGHRRGLRGVPSQHLFPTLRHPMSKTISSALSCPPPPAGLDNLRLIFPAGAAARPSPDQWDVRGRKGSWGAREGGFGPWLREGVRSETPASRPAACPGPEVGSRGCWMLLSPPAAMTVPHPPTQSPDFATRERASPPTLVRGSGQAGETMSCRSRYQPDCPLLRAPRTLNGC